MASPARPITGGRPFRSDARSRAMAFRFSPGEEARLREAARLNFQTPSDFVRSAALLAVDDTIERDPLTEPRPAPTTRP